MGATASLSGSEKIFNRVQDPVPIGNVGSNQILVFFEMLVQMRMEEDGLSVAAAGDAVIRDNLFGLEIDPRCTQIAAFNLALTAWKSGGYRGLPLPNIACSGIPVQGQLDESWSPRLGGMAIGTKVTLEQGPVTTLEGVLLDQAALAGVLDVLHSLCLPVISVEHIPVES